MAPRSNPMTISRLVPPTPASLPMTTVVPQPTPVERKGKTGVALMPRLFDMSCDETLCSADSFCVNDYTWGALDATATWAKVVRAAQKVGSWCVCVLGGGWNMLMNWSHWAPEDSFAVHTWFLQALFLR